MYRVLLTELDAGSAVHLADHQKITTNLILNDCISDILYKFTNRLYVCFVFPVPNGAGSHQN